MNPIVKSRIRRLEAFGTAKLNSWVDLVEGGRYQLAAKLAIATLHELSCRNLTIESERYCRFHRATRIVFNGIRDLSNLMMITSRDQWWTVPHLVEEAWGLALDAETRLARHTALSDGLLDYCAKQWDLALNVINQQFGNGIYTSWEMVFDGFTCSICRQDTRSCSHIPGRWYAGKECTVKTKGGVPRGVALVDRPVDRRCRIWSWQRCEEEDGHTVLHNIPIFILFHPEGDVNGGRVVTIGESRFRSAISGRTALTSSLAVDRTAPASNRILDYLWLPNTTAAPTSLSQFSNKQQAEQ